MVCAVNDPRHPKYTATNPKRTLPPQVRPKAARLPQRQRCPARCSHKYCQWGASIGQVWTRHLAPAAPASRPSLPTQFHDCACHADSALQFLSLPSALNEVRVGLHLQGSVSGGEGGRNSYSNTHRIFVYRGETELRSAKRRCRWNLW